MIQEVDESLDEFVDFVHAPDTTGRGKLAYIPSGALWISIPLLDFGGKELLQSLQTLLTPYYSDLKRSRAEQLFGPPEAWEVFLEVYPKLNWEFNSDGFPYPFQHTGTGRAVKEFIVNHEAFDRESTCNQSVDYLCDVMWSLYPDFAPCVQVIFQLAPTS